MVKRELLPRRQSLRWDPIRHYTHQVALVRQFIPSPEKWEKFLGSLGTGIFGVRPMMQKSWPCKAEDGGDQNPGFIFLFLNAGSAKLQEWNGRAMSGFASSLDRRHRVLRWESQRNDKTGRVILQIIDHIRTGDQVVVAVRSGPGQSFRVLGYTRDVRLDSKAEFLLRHGDHLVGERGSARMHKHITAQCIDGGLKRGIGLVSYTYPLPQRSVKPQFCSACCWKPATAALTFGSLDQEAADILEAISKPVSVAAVNSSPVQRRLHSKQAVKRESDDPCMGIASECSADCKLTRTRRRWQEGMLIVQDQHPHSAAAIIKAQHMLFEQAHQNTAETEDCSATPGLPCNFASPQRYSPTKRQHRKRLLSRSLLEPTLTDPTVVLPLQLGACSNSPEIVEHGKLVAERNRVLARLAELDIALEAGGLVNEERAPMECSPESADVSIPDVATDDN